MTHGSTPAAAVAAELEALFAAPVRITVGGEHVAVRGVVLDELAEFLRLYERRPPTDDAGGVADAPADQAALADWGADFIVLLARLCGRRPEWVAALPDAELDRLCAAMRQANPLLFDPAPARHGPRNGRGHSWATAAAHLIECGHALHELRGYTLVQIEQLLAAHARLAADRRLDELAIARAAQADQKGYRRAVAALDKARAKLG